MQLPSRYSLGRMPPACMHVWGLSRGPSDSTQQATPEQSPQTLAVSLRDISTVWQGPQDCAGTLRRPADLMLLMLVQGSTGCAVKNDLVLSLQMAQVVLKQRDLEGMQVEGIFELWKVPALCCASHPKSLTGM